MRVLGAPDLRTTLDVGDVDALVERLRPPAARADPFVVVVPAAAAATAARTVSLGRAGAPGAVGVVHASTLPPLALDVVGDLLAGMQDEPVGPRACWS
ncbi:hypothetical protein GCM10025868_34120 [Angustibacter aerolatus]|uniref:Uncharacterized protein n=1 Tax=Angustibacter aerolatus TaxID=1162965 RepID=A0ABQ6JK66_9ACTN|nr:hypothetical protein GCM10025868_34120 [Angustibacter aerolatus]